MPVPGWELVVFGTTRGVFTHFDVAEQLGKQLTRADTEEDGRYQLIQRDLLLVGDTWYSLESTTPIIVDTDLVERVRSLRAAAVAKLTRDELEALGVRRETESEARARLKRQGIRVPDDLNARTKTRVEAAAVAYIRGETVPDGTWDGTLGESQPSRRRRP